MNIVNVFRLHYFIYWGSISAILNYSVLFITEHAKISQNETGILYCILPLALIFAKPIFCSIADKYVIHEWILITFIFGTTFFYGLLSILPFIPNKALLWPLFCIFMILGQTFSGVLVSITDSMVVKIAEKHNTDFGKVRVAGTIGWGLLSLGFGYLNNLKTNVLPIYVLGFLFFITLELADFALMFYYLKDIRREIRKSNTSNRIENIIDVHTENESKNDRKKTKKQITKFVLMTCRQHPMLIKHIFICIVIGILTGIIWNFLPLYLNNLKVKDSNLIGLVAAVQTFGGEMPFLYFAQMIVTKIGLNGSLSLALLAYSVRCMLYTFLTPSTAYFVLFIEPLHGVAFSLFYFCMNLLASQYNKKMIKVKSDYLERNGRILNNTQIKSYQSINDCPSQNDSIEDSTFATMQGIMSGSFDGIGVAIGSLISGFFIQSFGFKVIWYSFSGLAFVVFLLDLILMSAVFLKKPN